MTRRGMTVTLMMLLLLTTTTTTLAQVGTEVYQQMSPAAQADFISARAQMISLEISGRPYSFTPEFVSAIQQNVDTYLRRSQGAKGKRDLRLVLQRGQALAPALGAAFQARNVSQLLGIYLPWIESEYTNIQQPNSLGAIGMFQFLPQTGQLYGLSVDELLDVEKSADAAARYLIDNIERFKHDSMREALALLAYNRGSRKVVEDLGLVITDQNSTCSICALTAASSRLDKTFQGENVQYVPRFFAAAIIGENPRAFGFAIEPLSSHVK